MGAGNDRLPPPSFEQERTALALTPDMIVQGKNNEWK
jgi:hypothetical protein